MKDARQRREAVRKSKPFNFLDIVFFGVLLAFIALMPIFFHGGTGKSVIVTSPTLTAEYPLSEDAVIDVDGYLTLVIKDGKAYVEDSQCPDKICVYSGEICREGSMIACLPGGIVITVSGESDFVEVG